ACSRYRTRTTSRFCSGVWSGWMWAWLSETMWCIQSASCSAGTASIAPGILLIVLSTTKRTSRLS
ncbi:hypothetical protein LPJ57_004381, partial [Coemansia sp. RSA 486]